CRESGRNKTPAGCETCPAWKLESHDPPIQADRVPAVRSKYHREVFWRVLRGCRGLRGHGGAFRRLRFPALLSLRPRAFSLQHAAPDLRYREAPCLAEGSA